MIFHRWWMLHVLLNYGITVLKDRQTNKAIFAQKRSNNLNAFVLDGSWSRPGRDLAPKTLQVRIFIDLGSVLVDCLSILGNYLWIFDAIFAEVRFNFNISSLTCFQKVQHHKVCKTHFLSSTIDSVP